MFRKESLSQLWDRVDAEVHRTEPYSWAGRAERRVGRNLRQTSPRVESPCFLYVSTGLSIAMENGGGERYLGPYF